MVSSRKLTLRPDPEAPIKGLQVVGPNGTPYAPTNWAFGQLAGLGGGPAGYLRTLPAPIAADAVNYGLKFKREVEEIGCLIAQNGEAVFKAATGPNYGRIWDADIAAMLVDKFEGTPWKIPGEFGVAVEPTIENTTLYASDRDMFVFLADEERRIEIPNRRNGQSGSLARGFFLWNSEVGDKSFGAGFFLFDYACCNRIVWGAEQYTEMRIRHTSGAPDRWLEQVVPVLEDYANAAALPVQEAIAAAQARRLTEDLDAFLAERFGKNLVGEIKTAHEMDEGRPMETIWDVVTGATAYARLVPNQDRRVAIERTAGALLAA